MNIQKINRKTIKFQYSGRSSDYIFPSIAQGCVGNCVYCYAARHFPESFYGKYQVSQNIPEIIDRVKNFNPTQHESQTDPNYFTWDIACNADILPLINTDAFDWQYLFDYFKNSPRDKATLATKFVSKRMLDYNPNKKVRVRTSLMPEETQEILEPKTASIAKRIHSLNDMYAAGYEVHINFSPVVVFGNWLYYYEKLFNQLNTILLSEVKKEAQAEVIFLTHNKKLHEYNLDQGLNKAESFLWKPRYQEDKISKFGGHNIRYKYQEKALYINQFKKLMSKVIPWCNIRYIF